MEVFTASFDVRPSKTFNSYNEMKERHFDEDLRKDKDFCYRPELLEFNESRRIISEKEEESILTIHRNEVEKYDERNRKSRRHGSLENYVKKRSERYSKQGLYFTVSNDFSNMDDFNAFLEFVEEEDFNRKPEREKETLQYLKGFYLGSEQKVRKAVTEGLFRQLEWVDETFSDHGLRVTEGVVNHDERGAPHIHANILLTGSYKSGLPNTNFDQVLKSYYGPTEKGKDRVPQELWRLFRKDLDEKTVEFVGEEIQKEYGDFIDDFELERKTVSDPSFPVGRSFSRYQQDQQEEWEKLEQEKEKQAERALGTDKRVKLLEDQRMLFAEQLKALKEDKDGVKEREDKVKKREEAVQGRESAVKTREGNAKTKEDKLKDYEKHLKGQAENIDFVKANSKELDFVKSYVGKIINERGKAVYERTFQEAIDEYDKQYNFDRGKFKFDEFDSERSLDEFDLGN